MRWLSHWQPDDSPFPAFVSHTDRHAAEAHAIFIQTTTGCVVDVTEEQQ
jgi:hypothetical protein